MPISQNEKTNPNCTNIPIVIGVTGHRDLQEIQIPKLREGIQQSLKKLMDQYSHSPFVMLNSLAAGADQLCAEIALEMKIPLIAALPLELEEYEKDFSGQALNTFKKQYTSAEQVIIVPPIEESILKTRDFHYRQAGIYVANHCHVLLALWDGSPAQKGGCGTSEVVDFKLNGNFLAKNTSHFQVNDDAAVIHIMTARKSHSMPPNQVSVQRIENVNGANHKLLSVTDAFNEHQCRKENIEHNSFINEEEFKQLDFTTQRIHYLYQKADYLSLKFRNKYLQAIKWLSIFAVILVLSFLVYDELESNLFLIFYGFILLCAVFLYIIEKKYTWHTKYLEYRVFAESLRVQFYLFVSGINHSVCDDFSWSQKKEVSWVANAIQALIAGFSSTVSIENEKQDWINEQYTYHNKKWREVEHVQKGNNIMSTSMMIISLIMFIVILFLEFRVPHAMTHIVPTDNINRIFLLHPDAQINSRGILKIILGVFSAVSLFLSNYYGKLMLDRKVSDHKKMASLYKSAQDKLATAEIDKENLLLELAREEIIENGGWLFYNRDNAPSINI